MKTKMKKTLTLIIILSLVVVSGSLMLWAGKMFSLPSPVTRLSPTPSPLPGIMAVVGQDGRGEIVFDPSGMAVAGADAILLFDPLAIKIGTISSNEKIFGQTLTNRQQEKEGKIKITAYLPQGKIITPQTLVAFDYQLLGNKPTALALEFAGPGQTTDSNLIYQVSPEKQIDILGTVTALRLEPK